MKTIRAFLVISCTVALAAIFSPRALAVIDLSFSGGSGTPLSITIDTPLTYTITYPTALIPVFVFKGVGNLFDGADPSNVSTVSYTDNAGMPVAIDGARTGTAAGDFTSNDLLLFSNSLDVVQHDDLVVLEPGTFTTTIDIAAPAPADGIYESFISTGDGQLASFYLDSVPEPSAGVMLPIGLVAFLGWRLRQLILA